LTRSFERGERVVIREVLKEKVWTVRPVTVLHDSPTHVVTWLAPGTRIQYPLGVERGEKCLSMWLSGKWDLYEKDFHAPGMLRIAPTDAPFEVFAQATLDDGILSWYVNFERPLQRTAQGFDTMDEILDLVVARDFSEWARKDTDELELAVRMGFFRPVDAARIDESCGVVESNLARGDVPWPHEWETWRGIIESLAGDSL
jgi:predicted RNA-binding protein associated with RNAse of E/G family